MARPMNYESVAAQFDRRYLDNDYSELEQYLITFITNPPSKMILEVGCGSGHWLEVIGKHGHQIAGIDPSPAMLNLARQKLAGTLLVQGTAEAIPWPDASFDRVYAINALHHFNDREKFIAETYRLLRSGGGLMTVGLDPHTGLDQWSIYHYWPETLQLDKERYLPTVKIRQMMRRHGFMRCQTSVAQIIQLSLPAPAALKAGRLTEYATSQLGILTDKEYNRGIHKLLQDIEIAESKGLTLKTWADLRLYATIGWKT